MEIKHCGGYLMIKEISYTEIEISDPIGLEIHAQLHSIYSDNEINDMTFYNYKIINRSTLPLSDVYFGQWVDPDLGYYLDDYVGCDVSLGLGICYNGDAEDEEYKDMDLILQQLELISFKDH